MDETLVPVSGNLYLLQAPRRFVRRTVNAMLAGFALTREVRVLDGGNLIDLYGLAREVRLLTADMKETMQRVHVARAFTCYQMTGLLCDAPPPEVPVVVLELLGTFYDENVEAGERARLLETCLARLRRLCSGAPVVVTAGGRAGGDDVWLERLREAADQVWQLEAQMPETQLRLF